MRAKFEDDYAPTEPDKVLGEEIEGVFVCLYDDLPNWTFISTRHPVTNKLFAIWVGSGHSLDIAIRVRDHIIENGLHLIARRMCVEDVSQDDWEFMQEMMSVVVQSHHKDNLLRIVE